MYFLDFPRGSSSDLKFLRGLILHAPLGFWSNYAHPNKNLITLFFYKKVVYKKVYIKWPKLKKVFMYNMLVNVSELLPSRTAERVSV